MKKIYLSLLSIAFGMGLQAQLTQSNHAPANGDSWQTYQCDSTGINPGTAGTGKSWNFSSIATRSFILVSSTAANVSAVAGYPAANVSVTASNNNSTFYNSSTSKLDYYGGHIALSGITADLKYGAPALYAFYPMTISTASTANTSGTIVATLPVAANGTFTGNSSVIADATGTMMLPGANTFTDVTRVQFNQVINFAVSSPFPATGTITQQNFDYYQSSIKAPIFSISIYTVNVPGFATSTQTLVTRNKNAVSTSTTSTVTTNASEQAPESTWSVFPNPSSTVVNFSGSTSATDVMVFDVTGKLVIRQSFTERNAKIDVSPLNTGLYIYSIRENDSVIKTGKFTVNH